MYVNLIFLWWHDSTCCIVERKSSVPSHRHGVELSLITTEKNSLESSSLSQYFFEYTLLSLRSHFWYKKYIWWLILTGNRDNRVFFFWIFFLIDWEAVIRHWEHFHRKHAMFLFHWKLQRNSTGSCAKSWLIYLPSGKT